MPFIDKIDIVDAYVGKPYLYKVDYDFRDKTSSQIASDWWETFTAWWSPTYSYWSSWFTLNSVANAYWWLRLQLPSAITNQNKIVMSFTWYIRWANRAFLTLWSSNKANLQNNNSYEMWYSQIWTSTTRNDQWISAAKIVNWTKYWGIYGLYRTKTGVWWEFNCEIIYDLPNNTAKWTCYSPSDDAYSMEWQLTTEWLNAILWTQYFFTRLWNYESPSTQNIYTTTITIY